MWIITAWQNISLEVTVKGFKKSCISSVVDGTDGGMLWNDNTGMGMLGVREREMEVLTVKMKIVTLIGNSRQNVTHFVYYVYPINSEILCS
jgi:hypothetical protein